MRSSVQCRRETPERQTRLLGSEGAGRRGTVYSLHTWRRVSARARCTLEGALVQLERSSEYAHELLDILVDRQATDVVLLDLTSLASFADYFVIATVDNVRQARAILDTLTEAIRGRGEPMAAEGDAESGWILIDAGEGVYVHLFSLDARIYYNLEGLWHKAQEVVRVQ